ncbi:hypothetical protein NM688_g6495 [Phlebia brevispora]|uniref:Uncharacterized protein n=1 Tax=Phlebia brevispora TaxID=194682 RepID=A0ACC1SFC2_9APHY|nr:hypothetical protein NM688_g6495 [Phlebia brevispora]
MDSPSTSAAALKEEIARLTGAIDRFKSTDIKPRRGTYHPGGRPRNNVYINPNYKPPSKSQTPTPQPPRQPQAKPQPPRSDEKKDVVIGGVTFESSGRSLVRKDCTPSSSSVRQQGPVAPVHDLPYNVTVASSRPAPLTVKPPVSKTSFASTHVAAHFNTKKIPSSGRAYKPKTSRRGRPMNRNMTLTNNRRPNGFVFTP